MTRLSHLKLGIFVIGLVLWGYGARTDHSLLRWMGIGFIAAAALLRFVKERPRPPGSDTER